MQPRIEHRYLGEIQSEAGARFRTPLPAIDWVPVLEWHHWQDARRGASPLNSAPARVTIRPRWDARDGPPYIAGVDVMPCDDNRPKPERIPLHYFSTSVHEAVRALVKEGRMLESTKFSWRICALEVDGDVAPTPAAFTVEQVSTANEVVETRRMRDLLYEAVRHGPARVKGGARDFPVLMSSSILEQTAHAATAAGELEAGGILLGKLWRSADSADFIAEVTAQVPATETVAEDTSLRFTPRTWQAVSAAVRLRGAGERILGWWHTHPRALWACHACPPERRAHCAANRPFFSPMDVALHRTAFQGAGNVALLLSFQEDPTPRHDLFGWRQGLMAARGYYVVKK